MEVESEREVLSLPPGWEVIREKRAGQVAYYLIQA
jgi:16S rRNA G966 N2-methylase RsmD